MTEEGFTPEQIDDDVSLYVYCSTCAHVLMSLSGTSRDARECAENHWNTYSKNHTVILTGRDGYKIENL